uniref:HotDog ACOT-type domain-containing protein n=1 Tax=Coccolithus braarudii TaxID=221442 RepID=A0A7S0LQL3_9EUKA
MRGLPRLMRSKTSKQHASCVDGFPRLMCSKTPKRPLASTRSADLVRPGVYKSPITSQLWADRENFAKGTDATAAVVFPITKRPSDSATSVTYAFSSDATLRDRYRSPYGAARTGDLLEDMDALAGNTAFKHAHDDNPSTRPPLLVTASVDQIKQLACITLDKDVHLSGVVSWVGRSSMRIQIKLEQADRVAMGAAFTFVARDRDTGKAVPINPLLPTTDEEKREFAECEERVKRQKAAHTLSAEQELEAHRARDARVAQLLREAQPYLSMPSLAPADAALMRGTQASNALICQPQQRNTAGRIFGGFLMRRAFELAYSTCYLFAGSRPIFEQVEHVSFRAPVDVGSLLRLSAQVVLTQPQRAEPLITVDVTAVVARPEERLSVLSNTFTFTFSLSPDEMVRTGNVLVKAVLPSNSEEALRQLEVVELLRD